MRKFLLIVITLLLLASCKKDVQPTNTERFMKFFSKGINDHAYDFKQTNDGGYIIAGYTENDAQIRKAYALKINQFGDLEWQNTYGEGSEFSEFKKVRIIDNSFYFFGTYQDTSSSVMKEMYLVNTDLNGNMVTEFMYGGTQDQEGNDFGVMSNGDFILGGSSSQANNVPLTGSNAGANPEGVKDLYLLRVPSDKDSILNRLQAGGNGDDELVSLAINWDGIVYCVGTLFYDDAFAGLDKDNIGLIKINTKSNNFAIDDYDGFGSDQSDNCNKIQLNDGGLIISGNYKQNTSSFINKIPSYENLRIVDTTLSSSIKSIEQIENFVITDFSKTSDDGLIVSGKGTGMVLIKLDASGEVVWYRDDADLNGVNSAIKVIQTSTSSGPNGYAVIGNTGFGNDSDIMFLKVNEEGEL